MSEFVKKTIMGYKAVQGGHTDPECTHVVLELDEYDKLIQRLRGAESDANATRRQTAAQIQSTRNECSNTVNQIKAQTQTQLQELQEKLEEQKSEAEYQIGLNKNLLRISRERANADRKLKPKKEHTGYVVISSMEKDHTYKHGSNRRTVRLWETVLQSPYSVDFTEEQARTETEELFQKDESGQWPIGKMGINGKYLDGYGEMIRAKDSAEWLLHNVIVEQKLRANFRAGYWELVFLHTKPLGIVPDEMRPR